jgi:hypothetical protein
MACALDGPGLVELLAGPNDPPDDLDIITESTEQDSWMVRGPSPRPDDLETETRSIEQDRWRATGPDDLDTITKSDGERDRWAVAVAPKPVPRPDDLDTETSTSNEIDSWA